MEFFKVWVMPPLVGAVIGYFTNWLAVKMLFRPLKPVRIGRLTLPFTPGILPRERRSLAESIGDTVSRELLNAEVFRERLAEPSMQAKIGESIYFLVDDLLKNDAAALFRDFARPGAAERRPGAVSVSKTMAPAAPGAIGADEDYRADETGGAGDILASAFGAVFSSADFRQALAAAAGRALCAAGKIPLERLLPPERLRALAERFAASWGQDGAQAMLGSFLDRLGDFSKEAPSLVSRHTLEPLLALAVRSLYEELPSVAEKILADVKVRADLNAAAMAIVRRAIGRLGLVQRLIAGAANYERSLAETMPETIQDLSESIVRVLREPAMADKALESILSYIENQRPSVQRPSPAPVRVAGFLPLPELKEALAQFFQGLDGEKEDFAENLEKRYRAIAEKPLDEILPNFSCALGADLEQSLSERETAPSPGQSAGAALLSEALNDVLRDYARRVKGQSLQQVLSISEDKKRKIADMIARSATQGLSAQSERLVEALDLRNMVVEKINSLDIAEIERIILQVVKNELAWITALGGILGAFIGFGQSVLSLF